MPKPEAEETGRYLITAHLQLPCYSEGQRAPRRFPSVLSRSEYKGWDFFHCTFYGGAMGLNVQKDGDGWKCEDPRWAIDSVEMIDRARYLRELEALRAPAAPEPVAKKLRKAAK
jgi:hypothetical protein